MFERYQAEVMSDMSPEQADSLNERYRTGLEAIKDAESEDQQNDTEES